MARSMSHAMESPSLREWNRALGNIRGWKKKILTALWSKEIAQGKVQVFKGLYQRRVRLKNDSDAPLFDSSAKGKIRPFTIDLPISISESLIAVAKNRGLREGKSYLILPIKVLLSRLAESPFVTVLLLMSFGPMGQLLDAIGLGVDDPLVSQTDPSGLLSGEAILLIKCGRTEATHYNGASLTAGTIVSRLTEEFPRQIFSLDLSDDSPGLPAEKIQIIINTLRSEGKRIRRVVVSGHGSEFGIVCGHDSRSSTGLRDESLIPLSNFARQLDPLRPLLSEAPDVFFNSCLLASTDSGKKEVNAFANSFLPNRGSVTANTIIGFAGYRAGSTSFESPADSLVDSATWLVPAVQFLPPIFESVLSYISSGSGPIAGEPTTHRYELK